MIYGITKQILDALSPFLSEEDVEITAEKHILDDRSVLFHRSRAFRRLYGASARRRTRLCRTRDGLFAKTFHPRTPKNGDRCGKRYAESRVCVRFPRRKRRISRRNMEADRRCRAPKRGLCLNMEIRQSAKEVFAENGIRFYNTAIRPSRADLRFGMFYSRYFIALFFS